MNRVNLKKMSFYDFTSGMKATATIRGAIIKDAVLLMDSGRMDGWILQNEVVGTRPPTTVLTRSRQENPSENYDGMLGYTNAFKFMNNGRSVWAGGMAGGGAVAAEVKNFKVKTPEFKYGITSGGNVSLFETKEQLGNRIVALTTGRQGMQAVKYNAFKIAEMLEVKIEQQVTLTSKEDKKKKTTATVKSSTA